MQLPKQSHHRFIQLLKNFGIVDFLGEEVDNCSRSGAAVQKPEQLLARVDILDI